jgi:cell division protein FtsI (penicillin-binding protein 3)
MAKPAVRIAALQVLLGLGALVVVGRATVLQVFEHSDWRRRAEERGTRTRDIVPRRGTIYDRTGTPLAVTYEAYHIRVAVKQLRDTVAAQELLQRTLNVPIADLRRRFNRSDIYFDGPYDATRVQPLRGVRGIYLDPVRLRERPMGELAAAVVGHTDRTTGRGLGGVEAIFDSALVGRIGRERYILDGAGRRVPLPSAPQVEARAGNDVILTLDHELQGIAEGVLRRAVAEFGARGGDVVMLEAATGRVRAVVSLRTPPGSNRMVSNTAAIIETNEPGSTAKIFTAAAMLEAHADTTPVEGEGGVWRQEVGRTVREHRDVHRVSGLLTLGEAIQHSSNIAMAKFALRLPTEQHYLTLRRFGFGTPSALGFPGEDGGLLQRPAALANPLFTKPSWSQGYEMNVTSVQMAAAYASLANGGVLIAPTLVEEIRDPVTGEAVWFHRPDTLRRTVRPICAWPRIRAVQVVGRSSTERQCWARLALPRCW